MPATSLTIHSVTARPLVVPLKHPIRTAVGTVASAPLVLIDVMTEEGVTGRAYVFTYMPMAVGAVAKLVTSIGAELKGQSAAPHLRMQGFDLRFRLIGWQGLIGMAVAGLDMAFWDAMGRAQDLAVASLLGSAPRPLRAYDSYGVVDPIKDAPMVEAALKRGFNGIKIKLGDGDLASDLANVRDVRKLIGPKIALMVDYNQSLDRAEAARRITALSEHELTWVEEPVKAEDVQGHAQLRTVSHLPIQTGENWWFPSDAHKAFEAGACDFAMPDVMKIGGVTGFMQVASLAAANGIPLSSHLFTETSAHTLAASPTAHWLEHLDIAGAVLKNPVQVVDGAITAQGPGLGLDWDEAAVKKFAV
ncbi:MAG: enolase C-terminal domain-like protein [Bosea sp. (in: a-proteobacteria)]